MLCVDDMGHSPVLKEQLDASRMSAGRCFVKSSGSLLVLVVPVCIEKGFVRDGEEYASLVSSTRKLYND